MKTYIVAYEATDGWRWTEKGKNHEIVSHGEAYSSKAGLKGSIDPSAVTA